MILVDRRQGSAELLPVLKKLGVDADITTLEYGDLCWQGNGPKGEQLVGVERKRIGDLMQCIISSRYTAHQLPGMTQMYGTSYLVVEGVIRPSAEGLLEVNNWGNWGTLKTGGTSYMFRTLVNFLNSVQLMTDVKVVRTSNPFETAYTCMSLHDHWQKSWEEHRSFKNFHTGESPQVLLYKPKLLRRVAKELPGIGWEKSKDVESKFKSVRNMVLASPSEWMEIAGIGKGIASKVVKELTGEELP